MVLQGDIISLTIFNIVVDAVIRECEIQSANYNQTIFQFYANNKVIASNNPLHTQQSLNLFAENFKQFAGTKTETMVHHLSTKYHLMPTLA
jgi:hypothetical protein